VPALSNPTQALTQRTHPLTLRLCRARGTNPRVIKRKMSSWHLKRNEHRYRPQPEAPPNDSITIAAATKTKPNKRQAIPSA
jgi:hypothetical protein